MISTTTADDLVREACEAEGWTMARSVQWLACETDEDFRDLARRDPFFAPHVDARMARAQAPAVRDYILGRERLK